MKVGDKAWILNGKRIDDDSVIFRTRLLNEWIPSTIVGAISRKINDHAVGYANRCSEAIADNFIDPNIHPAAHAGCTTIDSRHCVKLAEESVVACLVGNRHCRNDHGLLTVAGPLGYAYGRAATVSERLPKTAWL